MATFCVHFTDGTFTQIEAMDIYYAMSQLNQRGKRLSIALIYPASEEERVIQVGLSLNDQRRRHSESVR